MPTVAPNTPRETSVGFAGAPVRVLILRLISDALKRREGWKMTTYQPLTASTSMP
jgi:hypothetical protein